MNYLITAENTGFKAHLLSELQPEDSITFLIALEREKLAAEFDTHLKKLVAEAEGLKDQLSLKQITAQILIEWGNRDEILANALAREQAILLK
ncbi:MAG: hypothetical protein ABIG96_03830 [Candidatus Micrarchaeota archaeon]